MKTIIDLDPFVYAIAFGSQDATRLVYVKGECIDVLRPGVRIKTWCEACDVCFDDVVVKKEIKPHTRKQTIDAAVDAIWVVRNLTGSTWEDTELYLTGKGNFRHSLYDQYKGNRDQDKPYHYQTIRDYYVEHMGAVVVDGMEADDMVAIRATEEHPDAVIVSIDKDLKQVPGWYFNPDKPENGMEWIDEWTGHFNFYKQLLTGDKVDNIPGIRGIGPKKAEKLLMDCKDEVEMYEVCANVYADQSTPMVDMHRNARLLYMLRYVGDEWVAPVGA